MTDIEQQADYGEPWKFFESSGSMDCYEGWSIRNSDESLFHTLDEHDPRDDPFYHACLERAVDCVNACTGVPDERLRSLNVAALVREVEALRKEHDVVNEILCFAPTTHSSSCRCHEGVGSGFTCLCGLLAYDNLKAAHDAAGKERKG